MDLPSRKEITRRHHARAGRDAIDTDRLFTPDEAEFLLQCQAEKQRLGVLSLTPRQILAVAHRIGYRKIIALVTP